MSNVQNQIFQAIDTIAQKKIDEMQIDRLVEGIISSEQREKDNSYEFIFNGMAYTAYPVSNTVKYNIGDVVYVLAIGGDFSKRKVIISAKYGTNGEFIDISKELDKLNIYGRNYVTTPTLGQNIRHFETNGEDIYFDLDLLPTFIEDSVTQTDIRLYAEIETDLTNMVYPSGVDFGMELAIKYEKTNTTPEKTINHSLNMTEMIGNVYKLNFNKQDVIEDLELEMIPTEVVHCRLFVKKFPPGGHVSFRNVRVEFVQELIADISKDNAYSLTLMSSKGTVFKNGSIETDLEALVFKGKYDATSSVKEGQFTWTRRSEDKDGDEKWGAKKGRVIKVTADDVKGKATFVCSMFDTENPKTAELVAKSEVSLVDLHDTSAFEGYLTSNYPKMQLSDSNGAYKPDWYSESTEVGGLTLVPSLFKTGDGSDILAGAIPSDVSIYWDINLGDGYRRVRISDNQIGIYLDEKDYVGGKSKTLRIVRNIMTIDNPSFSVKCVIEVINDNKEKEKVILDADYGLSVQGNDGLMGAGYTILLTNETHQIITTLNGNPIDGELGLEGRAYTDAVAMDMTKVLTPIFNTNVKVDGTYTTSIVGTSGLTAQVSRVVPNRVYITSMDENTGYVDIKVCITGVCTGPSCNCPVKRMNVVKAPMGASWMDLSSNAITQDGDGVYTPKIIKMYAFEQSYVGTPQYVKSNFEVYSSKDGEKYDTLLLDVKNSSDATFDIVANADKLIDVKMLKVRMLTTGATPVEVDVQTIPVIAEGVNAIHGTLWCPDGEIFKNRLSSDAILELSVEMNVYSGMRDITGICEYKWYRQDKNKWIEITAADIPNYKPDGKNRLIVHADAVPSLEVIKCAATYKDLTFEDTVTLTDKTDPYQIIIQASTQTFKNDKGEAVLNCTVVQNAIDIDEKGDKMIYHWSKFGDDNFLPTADTDVYYKHPTGLQYTGGTKSDKIKITTPPPFNIQVGDYLILESQGPQAFKVKSIAGAEVFLTSPLMVTASQPKTVYYGNFKAIKVKAVEVKESNAFYCDVYSL